MNSYIYALPCMWLPIIIISNLATVDMTFCTTKAFVIFVARLNVIPVENNALKKGPV